jgi:hypothetical protein
MAYSHAIADTHTNTSADVYPVADTNTSADVYPVADTNTSADVYSLPNIHTIPNTDT